MVSRMKGKTLQEIIGTEDKSLYRLISIIADLSTLVRDMLPREQGFAGGINPYGEKQLQIDVWSNDLFTKKLLRSGLVKQLASEEMEEVAEVKAGEYSVVLDPLDGSSNLKSNNLLGTIVGIYREKPLPAKGRDLQASMYFLYGPFHQLVLALKDGVRTFAALGKGVKGARFVSDGLIRQLPKPPTVYGIGGQREKWTPRVRNFVESLEKRKLSLRYGGSFVGDYNQVLTKGGFFAYPELIDAPDGKYRLQFESNPVGFITEKAGGRASTGMTNILDVEPSSIIQRVPTYLGDQDLVREFESTYQSKS
ncbi:MAG TPA: class 1 fructose-bisphosphatase [Candidatus Angelobacter sp.]|nr:class 1 fructose-bisphosphatase [Candidatus Angelobacter sp.]